VLYLVCWCCTVMNLVVDMLAWLVDIDDNGDAGDDLR
jgi:hypothetical protein